MSPVTAAMEALSRGWTEHPQGVSLCSVALRTVAVQSARGAVILVLPDGSSLRLPAAAAAVLRDRLSACIAEAAAEAAEDA